MALHMTPAERGLWLSIMLAEGGGDLEAVRCIAEPASRRFAYVPRPHSARTYRSISRVCMYLRLTAHTRQGRESPRPSPTGMRECDCHPYMYMHRAFRPRYHTLMPRSPERLRPCLYTPTVLTDGVTGTKTHRHDPSCRCGTHRTM